MPPEGHEWYCGFLTSLSPLVRKKLLELDQPLRYAQDQTIFREGGPSSCLFIVRSGRVALDIHVPSKGRQVILEVDPGDLFSWSALVEPFRETASARALEDTEVVAIPGARVMELCRADHEFGLQVYRSLARIISSRLITGHAQLVSTLSHAA